LELADKILMYLDTKKLMNKGMFIPEKPLHNELNRIRHIAKGGIFTKAR